VKTLLPLAPSGSLIIRTKSDAERLLKNTARIGADRERRVMIRVTSMPLREAMAWESAFESSRNECGCRASIIAAGTIASLFVIYFIADGLSVDSSNIFHVIGAVIGVCLSGAIGKFVGRYIGRYRYAKTCQQLSDRLTKVGETAGVGCGDRAGKGSPIPASIAAVKRRSSQPSHVNG
jgi:hypothetical protein